ncbi:hypothetical protein ABCS02_15755 [Microbacterium sp. X-17]|uniref:hypothetical protein n=1 Tax=Microbacterium sp. X-17 TaxID=3144404 RepID=UPI0031F54F54
MTTVEDPAAARWHAADELAQGVADDGLGRRRRRVPAWILGLLVASWLLGIVLAFALPRPAHHASGEGVSVRAVAGLALSAVGFLVALVGFVWGVRTHHYVTRWRAVTSPLTRRERKAVMKQLRGKRTLDPEHADTIVAAGRQLRRATLGIAPLYAGLSLMVLGFAIGTTLLIPLILCVVSLVLFAVAGIQLLVYYRQLGAFLEAQGGGG